MWNSTSNEVRLLLDENVSPNIIPRLWGIGVDAFHLRDRGKLRVPDYQVVRLAAAEQRAIATIDETDFERLVSNKMEHPGVAVMPSGGSRDEQYDYLAAIVNFLRQKPNAMDAARNHIISVDEKFNVTGRLAIAAPAVTIAVTPTRA